MPKIEASGQPWKMALFSATAKVNFRQRSRVGSHTSIVTSTMLRTFSSAFTVARAPARATSTSRVMMSTTLNSRGFLGAGGAGASGFRKPKLGTAELCFFSPRSSGTMLAPVPFVSVSSTQTFANCCPFWRET